MATVSYTYDLKCNGGNVSQVKINGTDVKRVKVNRVDVIHKFEKYTTTVTFNCYIRFDKITKTEEWTQCGDTYAVYDYEGRIFVNFTSSGDSINDTGGVLPAVEFYFRQYFICNELKLYHKTISNIKPSIEIYHPFSYPIGTEVYSFSGSFTKEKDSDFVLCGDLYSDGSEMRTSWGNLNISASHYLSEFTKGTVDIESEKNKYIKLGSISKTFTKTVQEY